MLVAGLVARGRSGSLVRVGSVGDGDGTSLTGDALRSLPETEAIASAVEDSALFSSDFTVVRTIVERVSSEVSQNLRPTQAHPRRASVGPSRNAAKWTVFHYVYRNVFTPQCSGDVPICFGTTQPA
jgi:hypothetical protein